MPALWLALFCAGTLAGAAQKKVSTPPKPQERPAESWPVWGGPRHNFISTSPGLADTWPKEGPTRLWTRPLGDGCSAIAEENGVLFTGYRRGSKDVVTALNAATGKTVWEYEYDAPFRNEYSEVGPGPYAMPQVVGDRVVTASGAGKIHSLDKKTGRPVWSHDLYTEFAAHRLPFGYSCHGLPYKGTLIYLAGGEAPWFGFGRGSAVVAFRQGDGALVWKNQAFKNAHSSPLLINVDGQAQVVALLADQVIGFNPDNGELLWKHAHPTQYGLAVATPVWTDGNLLFVSSAYGQGARVLQLTRDGNRTVVKELWHNPRIQLHFGSAIRLGDYIYLSSGSSGPAFMTAVEVRTGRIAWQTRDFAKAQLLYADGKLIILDEDGNLGIARATPEGFQVLSRVSLLKRISWTPPTLVGTRLYVRDRGNAMALELGALPPRRKFHSDEGFAGSSLIIHTNHVYSDTKLIRDSIAMSKRINIVLSDETLAVLDRVAPRGNRSRLIDHAVRQYVKSRSRQNLRQRLKEGYLANAKLNLELAQEWFPLEEEAWQNAFGKKKSR